MGAAAAERPRCTFYLEKKRRHCRFEAKAGYEFCGNHLPAGLAPGKRVPCPGNPNHDVLESELEAHLKRCPDALLAVQRQREPFFKLDINGGEGEDVPLPLTDTERLAIRRAALAMQREQEGMSKLIEKVEAVWEATCSEPLPERVCCPPACEPYMKPDSLRPFSLKHARQQASIVGNMEAEGLLQLLPSATLIEFGAGRGYLTSMIADTSPAKQLILLDRTSFRFKADRSLRKDADINLTRLRCDIKDFDPSGAPQLMAPAAGSQPPPWLAVGKHLCGAATDFTLRCCHRHLPSRGLESTSPPVPRCVGVAIATCCHHRCTWQHYVGKNFCAAHGVTPEDFEIISWMTGWALCGHEAPAGCGDEGCHGQRQVDSAERVGEESKRVVPSPAGQPGVHDIQVPSVVGTAPPPSIEGAPFHRPDEGDAPKQPPPNACDGGDDSRVKQSLPPGWWLGRQERIRVGQMCKALIDQGRLLWLQEHNVKAKLLKYIPSEVSGENTLLIGGPTSLAVP